MAVDLDDKLLGEKVHYYCSSSEGEDSEDENTEESESVSSSAIRGPKFIPESELSHDGRTTNTGPKGVINDWREYKRLENERREQQEFAKGQLIKRLAMTCRSYLDDEKDKEKEKEKEEQFEDEMVLIDEDFLKEYRQRRIQEMKRSLQTVPKFGAVISLTSENFVDAIDKEQSQVVVIIHIYKEDNFACDAMNGSFVCLSQEYPSVKFCKIKSSDAQLSAAFSACGVPALLVYKNGELLGNFIRLSNELGDDFYASDVECFLLDHSFLPCKDLSDAKLKKTEGIRDGLIHQNSCDSDFDID